MPIVTIRVESTALTEGDRVEVPLGTFATKLANATRDVPSEASASAFLRFSIVEGAMDIDVAYEQAEAEAEVEARERAELERLQRKYGAE